MICVDASLAAKWILLEEDTDRAQALYRACIQADHRLVAPPLLASELTNILRQRMRRGQPTLSLTDANLLLRQFLSFPIELLAPSGMYELSLGLADLHNLSATYDAQYVALAQLLGCNVWTADQRLQHALDGKLAFVKGIAGYNDGDPL